MLGEKLLDAASQDTMRLTAESLAGEPGNYEAHVRVSLAGARASESRRRSPSRSRATI